MVDVFFENPIHFAAIFARVKFKVHQYFYLFKSHFKCSTISYKTQGS